MRKTEQSETDLVASSGKKGLVYIDYLFIQNRISGTYHYNTKVF